MTENTTSSLIVSYHPQFFRQALAESLVQTKLVKNSAELGLHEAPAEYISDVLKRWMALDPDDLPSRNVTAVGISCVEQFGIDNVLGFEEEKKYLAGDLREQARKLRNYADSIMMKFGFFDGSTLSIANDDKTDCTVKYYLSYAKGTYKKFSKRPMDLYAVLSDNLPRYVDALRFVKGEICANPDYLVAILERCEAEDEAAGLLSVEKQKKIIVH
jgi:hypothetical protein